MKKKKTSVSKPATRQVAGSTYVFCSCACIHAKGKVLMGSIRTPQGIQPIGEAIPNMENTSVVFHGHMIFKGQEKNR